jgi:hypothetical protein
MLRLVRVLTLLFLARLLCAQEGGDPWSKIRSSQPPDLSIMLRVLEPHEFRQGELIKAEVNLPDFPPPGMKPPAEHWQFVGLLLDPPAACGTVLKPCYSDEPRGGLIAGDFGGAAITPFRLNPYLPALTTGHYRVASLARKLVLQAGTPGSNSYGYSEPPQYAVSNSVEIDIAEATDAWVADTIARSVTAMRGPPAPGVAGYQAQQDAAWQLALLNTPSAWRASLELLPKEERTLLYGLDRGRPQTDVCELMRTRITAPAQSVSQYYLYRLAEICARAHLPPALDRSAPEQELRAWSQKWRAYTEDNLNKAAVELAASLGSKQGPAKWEAFAALLQRIGQARVNQPQAPDPAWIPQLKVAFKRAFPSIEPGRKRYLLEMYVSTLPSPDVIPVLEGVLDGWEPGDSYEEPRSALLALSGIDPGRAQARILAELAKDKTWLDVASLRLLPPSAVPPMDDALVEGLVRAQRPGGWSPDLNMAAIALYASPRTLPRIKAIYESQPDRCQPELVAYFVRVDPAFADRIFHEHPWDMHAPVPRCTLEYFERIPPLAMGPPIERYLSAYLMHGEVRVKSTAARVLERYGTADALPALWGAFRYFHDYWKGKVSELGENFEGVQLEVGLRNAIAHGRGWLAGETDLRTMEGLCVSGQCVGDSSQDLENVKSPLHIEVLRATPGIMVRVAQYSWLDSVAAVKAKLAQYPRGTRFTLYAAGGPTVQLADEVLRFGEEKGLVITLPEAR